MPYSQLHWSDNVDRESIFELVKRYRENKEFISNEETAKMALVVPFVRYLGYDPNNPREVRLEYSAEFVQGDGKRLPDRMDFAIFDVTGTKPLIVIETKPLGTDLKARAQQLARYLSQMPELHFGIITDGCHYLFYGDLDQPNLMDNEPFFTFSLDDPDTDWAKVAKFLTKFSRESFNAETLITDAENNRYREAMVARLAKALRGPAEDESFLRWLTEDVYKGKRTSGVMERLGNIARDAVEPALLRVMSDEFLTKLKSRMDSAQGDGPKIVERPEDGDDAVKPGIKTVEIAPPETTKETGVDTTDEELLFHKTICDICSHVGISSDDIPQIQSLIATGFSRKTCAGVRNPSFFLGRLLSLST
ncbi:MAG: restriction endonuclease [Candidatus Hydrogenedens sp.]|nr:restriction endonuclease [Candidatus Hydrogenedens sp.]